MLGHGARVGKGLPRAGRVTKTLDWNALENTMISEARGSRSYHVDTDVLGRERLSEREKKRTRRIA